MPFPHPADFCAETTILPTFQYRSINSRLTAKLALTWAICIRFFTPFKRTWKTKATALFPYRPFPSVLFLFFCIDKTGRS